MHLSDVLGDELRFITKEKTALWVSPAEVLRSAQKGRNKGTIVDGEKTSWQCEKECSDRGNERTSLCF